jgi:hypothetical protein
MVYFKIVDFLRMSYCSLLACILRSEKHPEVVNICISHACSSDTACVPHYFHSLSKYTLSYNSKRKIHNEAPDFLIDKRWNTMDIDRIASCDNPITPTIIKALIVSLISSFFS